ncbi:cytochrome c1 [Rhinichthys klamathensis goyatoka]|uniref:cytochrome c1 n=1 Tax=Rhinichthys klamathensis goyatoka TaxID=3034132 RepID=UPI0024B4BDBA|nr:cytochrome c1 [Rhinichthys klamathensis goyatoka]
MHLTHISVVLPSSAEEKPVEEEEAPVEAEDKGDAPETEADPPTEETDVTGKEIKPEEATVEVEKEPAPESPDQEETAQEEPAQKEPAPESPDQEETAQEEPAQKEPAPESADQEELDQKEPDQDLGVVAEEPVETDERAKVQSRGLDLSDALGEDTDEGETGDADKQSADQGKARSAGAASGPKDSGSGTVVGVVCGIAVAAVGAITGYFTYQKKKLCFKVQRGDPESAKEENGTQSDPQVSSTLLDSPELHQ